MEKIKAIIIRYAATTLIGAALTLAFLYLNGYSTELASVDKYRLMTDAFSIPGIIFIMVGALVLVSTQGFFDMISFGLGRFARALVPFSKRSDETYYDYKKRKSEERFSGYSFLFVVGGVFLLVAGIFMVLFFSVYK